MCVCFYKPDISEKVPCANHSHLKNPAHWIENKSSRRPEALSQQPLSALETIPATLDAEFNCGPQALWNLASLQTLRAFSANVICFLWCQIMLYGETICFWKGSHQVKERKLLETELLAFWVVIQGWCKVSWFPFWWNKELREHPPNFSPTQALLSAEELPPQRGHGKMFKVVNSFHHK